MALIFSTLSPLSFCSSPSRSFSPPLSNSSSTSCKCSSSSSSPNLMNHPHQNKLMEFPYVSVPHRNLMVDIVSKVDALLSSSLLPCTLPQDVQYFENQTGTAHAALLLRSAVPSSQVDFILGSWLHCGLPTGGALNITSFSGYLKSSTDAPNFFVDLVRSSPTSLILILDMPPRKDLVLHSQYLKTFYEDTQLDDKRKHLEKLSEVQPYTTSSLYIRSFVSPTAVMVRIEAGTDKADRLEEIFSDYVSPTVKEVLEIWLESCVCGKREVGEEERIALAKRDKITKSKFIEIDLGSNLPRLFGEDVATRVLESLNKVYNQ
ncbi:Red chlorophyll catabolite reductase [Heracleum sosnowskyi]|uniref:Red chlorophyll catabolite reductase n=1 Tax=Heracleum sosnowskyi TaxID=360622 RepID=A0AAD8H5E8_9APIA|nr:Red chlorophyll catabolite reductase [Heracleum sosnowskyi]